LAEEVQIRVAVLVSGGAVEWLSDADTVFTSLCGRSQDKAKGEGPGVEKVVVRATGPWPLVTWFETSLMQVTAAALGQQMQANRGWGDVDYYAHGMMKMCRMVQKMNEMSEQGLLPPTTTFMSGRRVIHSGFHLLQNLYLAQRLKAYMGTSSLFAFRVFNKLELVSDDGAFASWLPDELKGKRMGLVGTHAHEAQMTFQVLASEVDDQSGGHPLSALLWHMNYWLMVGQFPMLPDTLGSDSFLALLENLKFPDAFVEEFDSEWQEMREAKGKKRLSDVKEQTIFQLTRATDCRPPAQGGADELYSGLIRQDSGSMRCFAKLFSRPGHDCAPGNGGFKLLASEIDGIEDVNTALMEGYKFLGVGGAFGEKPWDMAQLVGSPVRSDHPKSEESKLDLVAKITNVEPNAWSCPADLTKKCKTRRGSEERETVFPVKLGDVGEGEDGTCDNWVGKTQKPGKFSVDPTLEYREGGLADAAWERASRAATAFATTEDWTRVQDALNEGWKKHQYFTHW
jgi:hypothetical protein